VVASSLNFLTEKYKCHILAYVIMPNHIHLILYFPDDNRLSDLMRDFKKFTSVSIRKAVEDSGDSKTLNALIYVHRDQKLKVWMDRFDDVCITSTKIFHIKLDYIHNNPLQLHWQLTKTPDAYPYSSAAFYEGAVSGLVRLTNYSEFIW